MFEFLSIPETLIAPIASFLFVFAVVFGLLITVNVIRSKQSNLIIALVIALFTALYSPITEILIAIMPIASILLIFLFFLVFIKKIMTPEAGDKGARDAIPMVATLALLLIIITVFWNRIAINLPAGITPEMLLWIIGIFIIVMIFYAVYQHRPEKQQQ